MPVKAKLFIIIFIITTACMTGLAFVLPAIGVADKSLALITTTITGLLVTAILFGAVSFLFHQYLDTCSHIAQKPVEVVVPEPARTLKPFDEKAVQVLSLFQKKGRLIDFLQEDITSYDDAMIGQAVRTIHQGCKEVLAEYMKVEPVMKEAEGQTVTLESGFDPSAVRLTGNVAGSAPFRGHLRHCGWRVSATTLPDLPKNQDLTVVEPAEVEIS